MTFENEGISVYKSAVLKFFCSQDFFSLLKIFEGLPELLFDGLAQLQAVPLGGPGRIPQHGLYHSVVQSLVALSGEAVDD